MKPPPRQAAPLAASAPAARQGTIEVAAGLVFRKGKLLITRRYTDAHQGGLWEFPGGKRDPQETFEQCLVRELQEELGIEVEVLELVQAILHEYPGRTVFLKFFRCAWRRHEPRALGCLDFRWVSLAEMSDFEFPAADARLLETLRSRTDLWRPQPKG
jgi:mutator protein MutT